MVNYIRHVNCARITRVIKGISAISLLSAMLESVHVLVHHNDVILQSKCHNVPITSKLSVIGREIRRSFPRAGVSPHKSGALPNASNKIGKSMAQANLPANTHFRVQATKHGGPVDDFEHEWDEWIPMLPQLEELPWSLQDISKVLRLGRTRDHFRIVSPQAVERVSFLLQRPLLRILREAKRLSVRYSRCSKQEIQTSIRLVFSVSMARTCLALASKALSLYIMSVDRFRRSKRIRSGLILPVGKIFRWLVEMKVAPRIYDAAAIYLTATLEYIAEELVFRAVNNIGNFSLLLLINHANLGQEYCVDSARVYSWFPPGEGDKCLVFYWQ